MCRIVASLPLGHILCQERVSPLPRHEATPITETADAGVTTTYAERLLSSVTGAALLRTRPNAVK